MRPGNFQMGQPRKRLRFTDWIQEDKARQSNIESRQGRDHAGPNTSTQSALEPNQLRNGAPRNGSRTIGNEPLVTKKGILKGAADGEVNQGPDLKAMETRNHPITGENLNKNIFQELPQTAT